MEESIVGSLITFRGLVYSPINEQGVVFLFGRVLEELNMYIEEIRTKYPDCVARRYTGKGWERVYIEFEFKSGNFIQHGHDPKECNMIVCWEDDLTEQDKKKLEGIEILELKSMINTPEIPNKRIEEPSKAIEKSEYDLQYHFERKGVSMQIQELYKKLSGKIKEINEEIFRKFSKTAITYYSPEKMFVSMGFRKNTIYMDVFTNQNQLEGIKNVKNHENWGRINIKNESQLDCSVNAAKQSYKIMKEAIKNNINTGWFALSKEDEEIIDEWEEAEKDPRVWLEAESNLSRDERDKKSEETYIEEDEED